MSSPANNVPQFATAEYASAGDRCKSCSQAISGPYYRVNGALACERCATQLQSQIPKDSHGAFVRALLFGSGAALVGLIGFAAFVIITKISIGYVSLAVGWFIGKAMHKGSNGIGGRRYQIAAAVLTYAAVSMAAIPIYIALARDQKPTKPAHVQSSPSSPPASSSAPSVDEQSDGAGGTASSTACSPRISRPCRAHESRLTSSPFSPRWELCCTRCRDMAWKGQHARTPLQEFPARKEVCWSV